MSANVIWSPNSGPQEALIACPVFEVFFGGARGGGKTEGSIGDWLQHSNKYGEAAVGIFFRRTFKQLEEVVARTQEIFPQIGAKWNEQKATWTMPGGGRLKFRYLEKDKDAEEYQGQNACVALGTPVLLDDGSWLAIERIMPGQMVMTLEGPRRVLSTLAPYVAPCVQARVHARDEAVLAAQVQPIWHPLASIAGLTLSRTRQTPQNVPRSLFSISSARKKDAESGLYADPASRGWLSWSEGGPSGCTAFAHELREEQPLVQRSFHAVLHAPSFRLAVQRCRSSDGAIRSRFHSTMFSALSWIFRASRSEWFDPLLWRELWRSIPGHGVPCVASGHAYAPRWSHKEQGWQDRYWSGFRRSDGLVRACPESVRDGIPLPSDADEQHRESCLDGLGTTPKRIHTDLWSLAHPYTGAARGLSQEVVQARVSLTPFGYAWVTDLHVEGANHYITSGGLINKNTRVYIEEICNFPSPGPINKLRAILRSGKGVPCCMRITGNPGGPGHQWVKKRYIDPAPGGWKIITESYVHPVTGAAIKRERVFIPSRVYDNPRLDDDYIGNLNEAARGNPALLKAWLDGNWDIVQGAFFEGFDANLHVLPTAKLMKAMPATATRFRSFDWGFAKPFHCGWYVVCDGKWGIDGKLFPRDALVMYREWYGCTGEPDVGLRMNAEMVARGILAKEALFDERIEYGVADPSIYIHSAGPSIMETMAQVGLFWRKADNKRVPGWQEMQRRLMGSTMGRVVPMLYFADCCEDSIRTIPTLLAKEDDPEDLDTESEDHCADSVRYGVMARAETIDSDAEANPFKYPKLPQEKTINELIAERTARRVREEA